MFVLSWQGKEKDIFVSIKPYWWFWHQICAAPFVNNFQSSGDFIAKNPSSASRQMEYNY